MYYFDKEIVLNRNAEKTAITDEAHTNSFNKNIIQIFK